MDELTSTRLYLITSLSPLWEKSFYSMIIARIQERKNRKKEKKEGERGWEVVWRQEGRGKGVGGGKEGEWEKRGSGGS